MNFVCIVFELGDKMLTLSSMENLIVQNPVCESVLYPNSYKHCKFKLDSVAPLHTCN